MGVVRYTTSGGKTFTFDPDKLDEESKRILKENIIQDTEKKKSLDKEDELLNTYEIKVGDSEPMIDENRASTLGQRVFDIYKYAPKAGWHAYERLFYNTLANIPGEALGARERAEKLGINSSTTISPQQETGVIKKMADGLYNFAKEQEDIADKKYLEAKKKAGSGFAQTTLEILAQTPGVVAMFGGPAKYLGPVKGMAGMSALMSAERQPDESDLDYAKRVGFAGAKGAAEGYFLKHISNFSLPTRITAMGSMGLASPAPDAETRLAQGVAFGALGIIGPKVAPESLIDRGIIKTIDKIQQSKNIAKAEKVFSDDLKSLSILKDQYNSYNRQVEKLQFEKSKLDKTVTNVRTGTERRVESQNRIKNINQEVNSINATKGKLRKDIETLNNSVIVRKLFSNEFHRDFDSTVLFTPTQAKLNFVQPKVIKETVKKRNAEGKYDKVEQDRTILVRNTKAMPSEVAEKGFDTFIRTVTLGTRKQVFPAKFLNDYPVTKYIVDLANKNRYETEYLVKQVLDNPKYTKQGPKKDKAIGLDLIFDINASPTNGGALTRMLNLSFKKQEQLVNAINKINVDMIEFRKLSKEEKVNHPRFTENQVAKDSYLRNELKLDSDQLAAREDFLGAFEFVRRLENDSISKYGAVGSSLIQKRENYFPHYYLGDYKVYLRNSQGDTVGIYEAKNLKEAAKRAKMIEDAAKEEGKTVSVNYRKMRIEDTSDISAQTFQDINRLANRYNVGRDFIQKIDDLMVKNYAATGTNARRLKRKDLEIDGFLGSEGGKTGVTNFVRAIELYVEGGIKSAQRRKLAYYINEFANKPIDVNYKNVNRTPTKIRDLYKHDINFAESYVRQATGLPINKVVEYIRNKPLGNEIERQTQTWYRRTARLANTWFLLALNPRFLMLQAMQPLQMLPHKLADMSQQFRGSNTIDATTHAYYSYAEGTISVFKPDAFGRKLTKSALEQGVITEAMLREYLGEMYYQQGKITPRRLGPLFKGVVSGVAPAGFMEKFTRLQAVHIFGQHMKTLGFKDSTILEQAPYLANKYMTEYHGLEAPMMFNSLGGFSRPARLFRTFAHNNYAQTVEAIGKAKLGLLRVGGKRTPIPVVKGRPAQMANFITSQAIFAGLKGIVGVTGVDFIIKLLNKVVGTDYKTLSSHLIELGLPDVFIFGGPSAAMQMDISNSLQAPSTDPTEFITFPSLEFAVDIIKSVSKLGNYYLNYKLSEELTGEPLLDIRLPAPSDVRDSWKTLAPTFYHGWIEAWFQNPANEGVYIRKLRGNITRENEDWRARKFAMRSLREAKQMLFMYNLRQSKAAKKLNKSSWSTLGAELLIQFDYDVTKLPPWWWDLGIENGYSENDGDSYKQIKRKADSILEGIIEQKARGGFTKQELEELELMEKLGIF